MTFEEKVVEFTRIQPRKEDVADYLKDATKISSMYKDYIRAMEALKKDPSLKGTFYVEVYDQILITKLEEWKSKYN